LAAGFVEIFLREPGGEGGLQGGPVGVGDAALVDAGLPEDAFKAEAEAQGGGAGGLVEGVALPLVAPIAVGECGLHHEEHGFGGGRGLLQQGGIFEVADFDGADGGVETEIAGEAGGLPCVLGYDGEKQGVAGGGGLL